MLHSCKSHFVVGSVGLGPALSLWETFLDGAELLVVPCDPLLPLTRAQGCRLSAHSSPDSLVGLFTGRNVTLVGRRSGNHFLGPPFPVTQDQPWQ